MSAAGSSTSVSAVRRPTGGPSVVAAASPRVPRSRRWAAVAVAVLALVPLAGCAAGIRAETSRERPTIDGIGSAVGAISVRNAYVGGPVEVGGSAPVLLSLFNGSNEPDRLLGVTSPQAGASTVPADLTVPAGGERRLYTPELLPRLTGITEPMRPGEIVPVVLTFERAGELRMALPVSLTTPEVLEAGQSAPPPAAPAPSASATPPAASASATPPAASPSATIAP